MAHASGACLQREKVGKCHQQNPGLSGLHWGAYETLRCQDEAKFLFSIFDSSTEVEVWHYMMNSFQFPPEGHRKWFQTSPSALSGLMTLALVFTSHFGYFLFKSCLLIGHWSSLLSSVNRISWMWEVRVKTMWEVGGWDEKHVGGGRLG